VGTPYLSEIRILSFSFAPKGWALCNGQLLPISQNQALFSLLGTTYGGDGRVNFALPNLQARIPMHGGQGHVLGESGGEQAHTVTLSETPGHLHGAVGSSTTGNSPIPAGNVLGAADNVYAPFPAAARRTTLTMATIATAGGNQPHNNAQPYLTLNFCIALQGIFPSQN
jgi:microcystin-dependent protein